MTSICCMITLNVKTHSVFKVSNRKIVTICLQHHSAFGQYCSLSKTPKKVQVSHAACYHKPHMPAVCLHVLTLRYSQRPEACACKLLNLHACNLWKEHKSVQCARPPVLFTLQTSLTWHVCPVFPTLACAAVMQSVPTLSQIHNMHLVET